MRIFGRKVRIGKSQNPYEQAQRAEAQRRLADIKLKQAQKIEAARQANIERRKLSPAYRGAVTAGKVASSAGKGVIALAKGVKSFANNSPTPPQKAQPQSAKRRAVYMSTSHGLKRIKPDNPAYAEAMAARSNPPPPVQRMHVKDSDDEQPPAFRGW